MDIISNNMIDYYKENYNKDIVEKAIEYSEQNESTFKLNELKVRLILKDFDNIIDDEYINKICDFINKSNKHRYIDGYLRGVGHAIIFDYGKDKLKNDKKHCDYVKNKNFAFVYRFGDNDFSSYFLDIAEEYLNRYTNYLDSIDNYSKPSMDGMQSYYIKDIEKYENPNNIVNLFKTLFKSFYLSSDDNDSSDFFSFEEDEKNAQHYLNYLDIKLEDFKFGTCEEIDEYVKENFTCKFNDKEYIWDNSETLVIKICNGEAKYEII